MTQGDWPLLPGEALLWEGRPAQGLALRPVRPVTTPLILVWGIIGLALLLLWAGLGLPGSGWIALGLAGFLAAQVWAVAAWNAAGRRRCRYAVTDRRVLIDRGGVRPLEILPLDPGAVRLDPGPPDCVILGRGPLSFATGHGGRQTTWQEYRLDMIGEGARVAELVRAAARANAPLRPDGWRWSVLPGPVSATAPRPDPPSVAGG
ncbi:hypothetical protein [Histidinibacterium lentulum]|uniref:DUF304 domain-containing protein n=1 Tax=Histidinibacterium lentulum TaxID=2480588 RepID=A0A3N2R4Y7_9RHOB|nr:hypothetical protein [Histidinibacterium lentulum]ROU02562.1 hypothetical protein EAT49_09530 [Histidinibacterium lentulum]